LIRLRRNGESSPCIRQDSTVAFLQTDSGHTNRHEFSQQLDRSGSIAFQAVLSLDSASKKMLTGKAAMPFREGIRLQCLPPCVPAIARNSYPIHRSTTIAWVFFWLLTGALSVMTADAQLGLGDLRLGEGLAEKCAGTPVDRPRPVEADTRLRERIVVQQHILPAGDHHDTDLEINGVTCVVPQGTYAYRNVNIWGGGSLSFEDAAIDFHAHSILVENGGTLVAGMSGALTGPVTIWLYGSPTDSVAPITCKSGATCGVPADIWSSNPNVVMKTMPAMGAKCTTEHEADSSYPGTDCFYQYEKLADGDPENAFFGRKVLAVSWGGSMILKGKKGIRDGIPIAMTPSDSGTSWVRLTDNLTKPTMTFHVDRPVPTWGNNDHIVLTSTDYLPSHSEEVVIASVGSDSKGTLITLQAATKYPHYGTAYDFSSIAAGKGPNDDLNRPAPQLPARHLETRAAVALLTRSIMIASEGDSPVLTDRYASTPHFPSGYYGGHTVIRAGVTQYQIQGVEYYQLGQGGVIGRYPIHFHMDRTVPQPTANPPFQGTYVADSSIHESNTRFITVHATQGLLLARNVGYRSIGHGFYLEDATETNNKLYSNIGIQARAAVYDGLNDRSVPGILAQPGNSGAEIFPYHSDYDHPSVFWIMNTWNDFQYNVAVGAGTCGACYWMPPSAISGSSVYETWDSYAGMQTTDRAGIAPVLNFTGNSCSTAMNSLETVGNTAPCLGVVEGQTSNPNTLGSVPNPMPTPYPNVNAGLRQHATICSAENQSNCADPDKVPTCSGLNGEEADCAATIISHYTTSFNWAAKNFSAIWLRGWWFLMEDSAITDVQGAGLTQITGGGYTRSDAAQGFWNLSLRNLFVGNVQPNNSTGVPDNPAASNGGPFNPFSGLTCPYNGDHCVSAADGISIPIDSFGNAQRLFNIYDGPVFEDSDAFADVHTTKIGSVSACKSPVGGNDNPGECQRLGWMNGYQVGVLQNPQTNLPGNDCILPNAAIAWKQPNGFYYPPAFHSRNLAFKNVDIRHFVVEPFWKPNSFTTDLGKVKNTYCTWEYGMFGVNFTDIDRQTELSDDDGALTGLTSDTVKPVSPDPPDPSISVNKDPFFNAPLLTPECSSSFPGGTYQVPNTSPPQFASTTATADASPYQYVSTVVYHYCDHQELIDGKEVTVAGCSTWGGNCTDQTCSGVPLYRQFLTGDEFTAYQTDPTTRPVVRLMGQVSVQRSNLTLNHGSYYIDTTLDEATQKQQINARYAPNTPAAYNVNLFEANGTYYVFFLFATERFHQRYSFYVGNVSESAALAAVAPARIQLPDQKFVTNPGTGGGWITNKVYDSTAGLLTLTVDLSNENVSMDKEQFCQPTSYCTFTQGSGPKGTGTCGCNTNNPACKAADNVCSWGVKDIDCPIDGCYGFSITMPGSFVAGTQPNLPPAPIHFTGDTNPTDPYKTSDPYFNAGNVTFSNTNVVAGSECTYNPVPTQQ
jgi:hypothetical protein